MKKSENFLVALLIAAVIAISSIPAWTLEKGRIITPGDFFPEYSFPMTLAKNDAEYLGLPQKFFGLIKGDSFSLKDIKADLILVEYLNKYCFSCQLQAPVMNQVFSMVEKTSHLKGKVKFIGIGAGNNQREVDSFKAEKQVSFPIIPDSKFSAYEAIGDPGATPFMLLVRKTDSGLLVAHTKVGLTKDPEKILKEINDSLKADVNTLLKQYKDPSLQQAKSQKLHLRYNEDELLKKAKESMLSPNWKVLQVVKINLPDGEGIYVGEIVNFLPLQVTKLNNLSWNEKEIEQMRQRLIGRSILQPVDFDPQVDAISSATMTAAIIVDSVNKAKDLYEGLKSKGYIK